jgi:hypothetical protein
MLVIFPRFAPPLCKTGRPELGAGEDTSTNRTYSR